MKLPYKRVIFIFLMGLFAWLPSQGCAHWSFEVACGGVQHLPTPLSIQQEGFNDINFTARYRSQPFSMPPYYVLRIGQWKCDRAWELEFIHHKLYLINHPEGVQRFTITNGYNLFTLNRAWLTYYNFIWRFGFGVVIAHPESKIHGFSFNEKGGTWNNNGYYLAGPTIMLSLGRRFYLHKSCFVMAEGKITASYADVEIAHGNALAPNVALHGIIGIGFEM